MSRRLKIILTVISCFIIIGSVAAWYLWNKPHLNVQDTTATTTITALALYDSFLKDPSSSKIKYIIKVIKVSGEVKEVSSNQQNQMVVLLKTTMPDASINCTMEENATNIKPGNTINIKGVCNGYLGDMEIPGDVLLIRCYQTN